MWRVNGSCMFRICKAWDRHWASLGRPRHPKAAKSRDFGAQGAEMLLKGLSQCQALLMASRWMARMGSMGRLCGNVLKVFMITYVSAILKQRYVDYIDIHRLYMSILLTSSLILPSMSTRRASWRFCLHHVTPCFHPLTCSNLRLQKKTAWRKPV